MLFPLRPVRKARCRTALRRPASGASATLVSVRSGIRDAAAPAPSSGKVIRQGPRSVSAASERPQAIFLAFHCLSRFSPVSANRFVGALPQFPEILDVVVFSFVGRSRRSAECERRRCVAENVPDSVRRRFRCPCLSPSDPPFLFPAFPIQPAYFFLSSEIVSGPVSVRFSRVGEYAIFVSRTRSADAALPPVAGNIKNRAQRSVRSCARLKISSAPTQNLNPAESVTVFRSCRVSISPDAITKSSARSSK